MPLLNPGIVVEARIVLVGTLLLVVLISTVMSGFAPEQLLQNRSASICVSCPVTAGVNVWASQVVVVMACPVLPTFVFC